MSNLSEREEFRRRLGNIIKLFGQREELIRSQYNAAREAGTVPDSDAPADLLERPTRRFLIDGFLRELGWDPDDPARLSEEARSTAASGDRLYFDYLGIVPQTMFPVLLVEAKAFDTAPARRPRGAELDASGMVDLLVSAIGALKQGTEALPVTAEWAQWLKDLRTYVTSLNEHARSTLRRVVITAGRWIIAFQEPLAAFTDAGTVSREHIHCFTSLDNILLRCDELFDLLARDRLVNTLPLTLDLGQALQMIEPSSISAFYRGVVVVTTTSGARRKPYPTRSVYPAVIVLSGAQVFGIVDYESPPEEPPVATAFSAFLSALEARRAKLEERIAARFGLPRLEPSPIEAFPGFAPMRLRPHAVRTLVSAVTGSTAEILRSDLGEPTRHLVVPTGERTDGVPEYLVVTGRSSFYKAISPQGPECPFHFWKGARGIDASRSGPHLLRGSKSFTEDGEPRHCAHDDLRDLRQRRCHMAVLETHMCCRVCVFYSNCWESDGNRLPCPGITVP
ncbi:hypothetical protein SAMN05444354_1172 [Stigmatella aurantiaca]|uniref:Uncharacterized protein n=1 Tax=Stigmatella aurantiaca TaxID=41 RepID=A0A1H7YI74_STIAU|nr:hypothetical protein [Stigmatella aurantiaca]SEM44829.1 hypothetical protein SAMN05444354_1172 [Stigmatella aurantiaca]